MSPDRVAANLTSLDNAVRRELANLPTNDWIFAQVLKGTRAILGQSGHPESVEEPPSVRVQPEGIKAVRDFQGVTWFELDDLSHLLLRVVQPVHLHIRARQEQSSDGHRGDPVHGRADQRRRFVVLSKMVEAPAVDELPARRRERVETECDSGMVVRAFVFAREI